MHVIVTYHLSLAKCAVFWRIFFDGQQQQQASPQLICVLFDSHHVQLVIRFIPLQMQTVLIF